MGNSLAAGRRRQRDTPSMASRLSLLVGERRRSVVGLSLLSIASGFTEAGILALIAQVAATLVRGASVLHAHIGPFHVHTGIGTLIGAAFALTIIRIMIQVPISILPARIQADVQAKSRIRLFDAFSRASWAAQSRDREGQLQDTTTTQVMQATLGAQQMTLLINSAFTFLVLMLSAFLLNPLAALVVGGSSALLFGLLRPLRGRQSRYSRSLSKAQVEFAGGIAEAIRVSQETQVFGVAEAQRQRIGGLIDVSQYYFLRSRILAGLVTNMYQSLIYLLMVAGIAALYYIAGPGRAGQLGGVVLVLARAGTAGQLIQAAYQGLVSSLPFIERTQEAESRFVASIEPDGEQALDKVLSVAFESVSFSYTKGRPVLSDISFEVSNGEVIGIIGPSGAGKSTLVQLLLRLRSPDEGRYLVNGVPAAELRSADWHRQISYVPQEPRLLHASVSDNISFFRDIDVSAVERAARLARIHDDVVSWPSGYETIVGPRADAVSGGQQQRICLARALAARPEVLVLDEPTSALDPHSEALIGESLKALKHELTLFIVAHRMSTLDMCDRVMVIVDGRMVAFDTKALLQRDNPYYRHASQLAAGPGAQLL
jgi:ABC-type multidrug transport system fused ATPase/permease subunit